MLELLATGSGIAFQDGGREGWRRYGVSPGGAMDRHAMRCANRLLGNSDDEPVLEIYRQGARIRVLEDTWLAIGGADFCSELPAWTARPMQAGALLEFSKREAGVFAYLALPGGFRSERWFGSVATDQRNGMGERLQSGTRLLGGSGRVAPAANRVVARQFDPQFARCYEHVPRMTLLPGPQFECFSEEARECLVTADWLVSASSDRSGYRLEGPSLEVPESIPSEPVLPGSFQVPGSGQPIVTMVDGPTVGGYAKIAILAETDQDRLAQCAPGTQLSFQWAVS